MTTDIEKHQKALLIQEGLAQFYGSETWYKQLFYPCFTYTEGVQFLARQAEAYWLLDLIFSCQQIDAVKAQPFQVWDIALNAEDAGAIIRCTDGNSNHVHEVEIGFTTFPLNTQRLYFTDNVLLLPSEY